MATYASFTSTGKLTLSMTRMKINFTTTWHAKFAVLLQPLKTFYERYKKYAPVTAFAIGFIYDSLTLTRIDRWLDNAILLLYTLIAGALSTILMQNRGTNLQCHDPARPAKTS